MKRYLIFAAVGPFLGGFLMLFATTYASGYWTQTNVAEVAKLFVVFGKTLQFAYLFGLVPALMMAAVDDILFHIRRIGWVTRMLIVGVVAFAFAQLIYGGPTIGARRPAVHSLRPAGLGPGDRVRRGWRINTPSRNRRRLPSRDGVTQLAAAWCVTM